MNEDERQKSTSSFLVVHTKPLPPSLSCWKMRGSPFLKNKVKPYRATFDFECMFNSKTSLYNAKKLTWKAKHIPLSVSVCSNIPNYDQPQCLVSEGVPTTLVTKMVDYLIKISKESHRLMKEEFHPIFEAIDKKLEKAEEISRSQVETNEGAEMIEEDEGEDLMDTDNKEEDIELETEEDRAFLDDEEVEEEGPSFYRAIEQELTEQGADDYDDKQPKMVSPEPEKIKQTPLSRLRDRLETT